MLSISSQIVFISTLWCNQLAHFFFMIIFPFLGSDVIQNKASYLDLVFFLCALAGLNAISSFFFPSTVPLLTEH